MDALMVFLTAVAAFVVFIVCGISAIINCRRGKLFWKCQRFWAIVSLVFIIVSIFLIANERSITKAIGYEWGIMIVGLYCASLFLVVFTPSYRKDNTALKAINKSRQASVREQAIRERENQKRLLADGILKTKYMSGDTIVTSKVSTSSAVGRAVVGNAIAGDVGAIVGASTAKQKVKEKQTTTFLVFYKDGHKNLETVENGTLTFEVYVDKLEIE